MPTQDSIITSTEIATLKSAVTDEMNRRKYTNSLKTIYGDGTSYATYTNPLTTGSIIYNEHYTKVATPLNAIGDTGAPSTGTNTTIKEVDIETLQMNLSVWEAVPVASSTESCTNATCQGLCLSSCSGGCRVTCDATCADDCTGGCSNSCGSTCYKNSNCSSNCNLNCAVQCVGQCTSTCQGTCENSCATGCQYTCNGQCTNTAACRGTCTGGSRY